MWILFLQNDGGESNKFAETYVNPWSPSIMKDLLSKINPKILKYEVRQCSFLSINDESNLAIICLNKLLTNYLDYEFNACFRVTIQAVKLTLERWL